MSEFHKELVKDWTVKQLGEYIEQLKDRAEELNAWIRYLKTLQKKKMKKPVFETGPRDGR